MPTRRTSICIRQPNNSPPAASGSGRSVRGDTDMSDHDSSRAPHRPRPLPSPTNTRSMSGALPETTKHEQEKAAGDYEVGYGKPPKATQFVTGKSGNPRGRPRAAQSLKTLIPQLLNEKMTVRENGKTRTMSKRDVVARQWIGKGLTGDHKVMATLISFDNAGEQQSNQPPEPLNEHERAIIDRLFREDDDDSVGDE